MNAATARIDVHGSADVSKIDAATTSGDFHLAIALPYVDAAAAGFDNRTLHAGLNFYTASTSFGHDLPLGLMHFYRSTAGVQAKVSADRAGVNRSAASFCVNNSANVIHVDAAAAALRVDTARKARSLNAAARSLYFHAFHFARNVYREVAREFARSAALPVGDDPG